MDTELKDVLTGITSSVKGFDGRITELQKQNQQIQTQVDAMDRKLTDRIVANVHSGGGLMEFLGEHEGVKRLLSDKKGHATLTFTEKDFPGLFQKTTITSSAVGQSTSGVLQIDRIPSIVQEARQALTVRDLLVANPTAMQVIDFVKVNSPMAIASPVVETNTKPENALTFTSVSEKVRTIATWIPASRQILDDMTELAGFINNSLSYYVDLAEEIQLLSGDGTGENLHGLIPQAAAFATSLLHPASGYSKIDIIGSAIEQVAIAKELPPTFAIVNPSDWWGGMRLLKNSFGQYILGDPATVVRPTLFGLTVVLTVNIAAGTFLVGSGNAAAAEIRDRMELVIDVSTEHSTFFTSNLVAVRAEKRLALLTKRPNSFVTGTFVTSP